MFTIRPNRPLIILGRGPAHGVEGAREVGGEDGVPAVVAHPCEQAVARDTGVVDQQLDGSEGGLDLGERAVDRLGVGDVGPDGER